MLSSIQYVIIIHRHITWKKKCIINYCFSFILQSIFDLIFFYYIRVKLKEFNIYDSHVNWQMGNEDTKLLTELSTFLFCFQ